MSLRTAAWRIGIPRSTLKGKKTAFFTATFPHHRSRTDTAHNQYSTREQHAKRSSVRPITLFALCIPLGYGLSLALRSHDAEDGDGFVKYTLAKKEDVSSTCSIFTLRPSKPSAVLHDIESCPNRAITSVQFKQPQLQIARFYTLLPPTQEQDPHEVRFLIRKEHNGEVSGYLHRLPIGSEIELRGMCVEYTLPEKVDEVLFLAGGTGVAPAMQVAAAVAGQADVHILWASRRREDCAGGRSDSKAANSSRGVFAELKRALGLYQEPSQAPSTSQEQSLVVSQLDALKEKRDLSKRVEIDYYVDEEGTFIQREEVSRLITADRSAGSHDGKKKILFVAGPDGFIKHWAASKAWVNGREVQGSLGGVLSQMDLRGWEVVKL